MLLVRKSNFKSYDRDQRLLLPVDLRDWLADDSLVHPVRVLLSGNPGAVHGLRHWHASAAAEMNFSELTIAGLLGHSIGGVTARYAVTPDTALISAADQVSQQLSDTLGIKS